MHLLLQNWKHILPLAQNIALTKDLCGDLFKIIKSTRISHRCRFFPSEHLGVQLHCATCNQQRITFYSFRPKYLTLWPCWSILNMLKIKCKIFNGHTREVFDKTELEWGVFSEGRTATSDRRFTGLTLLQLLPVWLTPPPVWTRWLDKTSDAVFASGPNISGSRQDHLLQVHWSHLSTLWTPHPLHPNLNTCIFKNSHCH